METLLDSLYRRENGILKIFNPKEGKKCKGMKNNGTNIMNSNINNNFKCNGPNIPIKKDFQTVQKNKIQVYTVYKIYQFLNIKSQICFKYEGGE